ncbi:MAG: CHASE2 domain-containing protein [Paludibacteraceae bacterium]|nr:CHASE2 domain-containing protein [Paludibacteraceae bacterium]
MEITNNQGFKQSALHAAAIALATVVFLFGMDKLLPELNTKWIDIPRQILVEKLQFTDLYFYFHRRTDVPMQEGRQVVLLDIHDYQTRTEVASLLDSVAEAKPYIVALDVIFGEMSMPDTTVNNRLVSAVKRLPNLILAAEERPIGDTAYRYERSFFAEEIEATEALVNFPPKILRKWSAKQFFLGDTFPTFAYVIAEKMGVKMPKDDAEWLIDYSIADTIIFHPQKQAFNWSFLRDQVVIIGDVSDLRDLKSIPLTYDVKTRVSGVQIHKQIVQTAIAQHWFKKVHDGWLWLITFIFLWLMFMCSWLSTKIAPSLWRPTQAVYRKVFKKDEEGLSYEKWEGMMTKALTTLLFLTLLGFGYLLFWGAERYFEMLVVLLAAPAVLWSGKWIVSKIERIVRLFKKL